METRRGEGGYIRIQKLPSLKDVKNEVIEEIGDALSSKEAFELLHFLVEKGLLTQREEHFLRIILQEAGKGLKVEDNVRANIIRSLFLTFL